MSNIIFKGDTVKNFGEYLPSIYIDNVTVRNNGANAVFLDIAYSLFFHVTDEFNHEDVSELLENVSFYFAISNRENENRQLLTQEEIISILKDSKNRTRLASSVTYGEDIKLAMLYPFSKESIQQKLVSGEYTDDVYDSQERKVMIISAEETISVITENKRDRYFYLYTFTSLYDANEFSRLNMLGENSDIIYNSAISNISYEKIFSPNFNIIPQTQVIYLDVEEAKYSDTPILGLNGLYYKNQTVTRELITDKVNELIGRFTTRLSLPRLTDATNSLKVVLQTYSNSENLLVEIERVRKSFPNKTNNNPTGNLYAALSRLVLNLNSSFPPGEIVTKERMVTGKVIDRREEVRFETLRVLSAPNDKAIPTDGFFIERNRISDDERYDLSSNGGFFFIRYEYILKNLSKASKLISIDRLLEFPIPSQQENLRRILYSMLRIKDAKITKFETSTGELLSSNKIIYDPRNRRKFKGLSAPSSKSVLSHPFYADKAYIKEHHSHFKGETPEVMLTYEFLDLDNYSAAYEVSQNEEGGMKFNYVIETSFDDKTLSIITILEGLLNESIKLMLDYEQLASEICSYNNIQNRFNNFFVEKINELYSESESTPWELSIYLYCLVQYTITSQFDTIQEVQKYAKNVIKTISPSFGTLESIRKILSEMENFRDAIESSGTEYFRKKEELMSSSDLLKFQKEFPVSIITQDTARLQQELSIEIASILNLFDYYDNLHFTTIGLLTENGNYEYTGGSDGLGVVGFTHFSEAGLFSEYINPNLKAIFDEVEFRLNLINKISQREGGVRFDNEGQNSALTYSLNDADLAGFVTGGLEANYYEQSDYWPSGWQSSLVDAIIEAFSDWYSNLLYQAKKQRDSHLLTEGALRTPSGTFHGKPFDYPTEVLNANSFFTNLESKLTNKLQQAHLVAFKEALAADGESGEFTDTEIKNFLQVIIYDDTRRKIEYLINVIFQYYRDNPDYLLPDLSFTGTGTAEIGIVGVPAIEAAEQQYEQISDPVTQLPSFITDYDPYIRYTGPRLEEIPDLSGFNFDEM